MKKNCEDSERLANSLNLACYGNEHVAAPKSLTSAPLSEQACQMKLYECYSSNSTCIFRLGQILMDLYLGKALQSYSTADGLHYCEPLYVVHNIVVSLYIYRGGSILYI